MDYCFDFFSLSLRHKPIATNIRPINQAKYPYDPQLNNKPPLRNEDIKIIIPIITNNKFIMLITTPYSNYRLYINKG